MGIHGRSSAASGYLTVRSTCLCSTHRGVSRQLLGPSQTEAHCSHRYIPADIRAAGLAKWNAGSPHAVAGSQSAAPSRHQHTASRVLHEVAHPVRSFKAHHKRKAEEAPRTSFAKKPRAGTGHDDDDAPRTYQAGQSAAGPDPGKVLKVMRLGCNSLK